MALDTVVEKSSGGGALTARAIIPTTTISGAGTTSSAIFPLSRHALASFQWVCTGTLSGAWTWKTRLMGTTWTNVNISQITDYLGIGLESSGGKVNGTAGSAQLEYGGFGAGEFQADFVYTSGSGTLTMFAAAKAGS